MSQMDLIENIKLEVIVDLASWGDEVVPDPGAEQV
jgi:hypothetical protein